VVRNKSDVHNPTSDFDFENTVTLIMNDTMLSKEDTKRMLKNIIPKEISEYILFEGETINKYKDLLDNDKNQEIYDSIRKILGIKILENSKIDLENQLDKYNTEKIQKLREQTKNSNLLKELDKYNEKKSQFELENINVEEALNNNNEKIKKYEEILKSNERTNQIINKKRSLENDLKIIEEKIKNQCEAIKKILKQYKIFCYENINYQINNIPNDIEVLKINNEKNENIEEKIKISQENLNSTQCKYCGHEISDTEIRKIKDQINLMNSEKIIISDEELIKLKKYNQKIETLKNMIRYVKKEDFKSEILNIQAEMQSKLIDRQSYKDNIKTVSENMDNLDVINSLEEVAKNYAISLQNKKIYEEQLINNEKTIETLKNNINSIMKKNPISMDFSSLELDNKIEKTKILISIFSKSIAEYSENMRKRVQKDATDMFKKISENNEYDRLEFDQYYGLKLFDIYNRPVPNISTGYMILITISLIYGLHNNSTLTGTIILDAPFSVLTNFHRNKIINAFQSLSPQVLLFVYKDQIDLESIRYIMQDKLINEYEIYQNKEEQNFSYKTNIRGTE